MNFTEKIANKIGIKSSQVAAVQQLFEEGGTIPFIARYRKERTGGLDEVQIGNIRDLLQELEKLEQRRTYVLDKIEEQGKLSQELKRKILAAENMTILEDLFLPFKQKRKTRASMAKEKGLEPLAKYFIEENSSPIDVLAKKFVNPKKEVNSIEDACAGAKDIVAEWISEDIRSRDGLRKLYKRSAMLSAKILLARKESKEAATYRDYFDFKEPIKKIPSHRFLAILRGNKEGFLRISFKIEEEDALGFLDKIHIKKNNECTEQLADAISDAYKRLLQPSLENEIKNISKEKADKEAIQVFSNNLKEILLSPPLGEKRVMGIDPGFRTGCKTFILDKHGNLKERTTLFFNSSSQKEESRKTILHLCDKHKIEAIGIGNGTGGKETRKFISELKELEALPKILVNESGASIYSASEVAREEFPDLDLTVRGAISIGRRLQDPLAEIVKIDPKSIGVGQYQYDVQQDWLKQGLDDLVVSIVNQVGVDVNSASKQLLSYVSGLGLQKAQNILDHRSENGPFDTKSELKKVKGIGPKAFEQAAGFIRIRNASNPLDASAVHPESYSIVKKMAKDLKCKLQELTQDAEKRKLINPQNYVSGEVGLYTLNDILKELEKPGRDPRGDFEEVNFRNDLNSIEDLSEGMILPGIVTNVTKFGAFVDIGVHQDGMVHISQLANKFVSDPFEIVRVNQKVNVKVLQIDLDRNRINLSIKEAMT